MIKILFICHGNIFREIFYLYEFPGDRELFCGDS